MARPRLLDLFCCAGGAAKGYHDAGFDVLGVDLAPQPRYPFEFVQADAMQVLADEEFLTGFHAIHASPPCQDYSQAIRHLSGHQPRLIHPVRELLVKSGLLWVIENVQGSPLPTQDTLDGSYGVELCGSMFLRPYWWHRVFETSFPVTAPPAGCDHSFQPMNPHRAVRPGGRTAEEQWRAAKGVPWMNRYEGRQAIPPVYTEHIGRQLMDVLAVRSDG